MYARRMKIVVGSRIAAVFEFFVPNLSLTGDECTECSGSKYFLVRFICWQFVSGFYCPNDCVVEFVNVL